MNRIIYQVAPEERPETCIRFGEGEMQMRSRPFRLANSSLSRKELIGVFQLESSSSITLDNRIFYLDRAPGVLQNYWSMTLNGASKKDLYFHHTGDRMRCRPLGP